MLIETYLADKTVDDELDVRVEVLPLGLGSSAHHLNALLHHVVPVLVLHAFHNLMRIWTERGE